MLARSAWREWIVPFAPLSVVWLAAFAARRRQTRALAATFALPLVIYVGVTAVLMAPYGGDHEYGAYLLPLAWPGAMLTVACLRRRWLSLLAVAAALSIAITTVIDHDDPARGRDYADGLRRHAGGAKPYMLVGDYRDFEAVLVHMPELDPHLDLVWLTELSAGVPAAMHGALLDRLDALVALAAEQRRPVYLTAGTVDWLGLDLVAGRAPKMPRLLAAIRERFRLETATSGGFAGHVVRAP